MILKYEEAVAQIDQIMHEVCDEAGIDYDEFVADIVGAFDAIFEIVEQ